MTGSERAKRSLRFDFAVTDVRRALLDWYRKSRRDLPWRRLWRQHADPYHIWVSEIMLQQTVIKAVLPVYDRFLKEFPTIQHLARATEADVRRAVRGLGYYRRFRMLHAASQQLIGTLATANTGLIWPQTFMAWKALPGIGDYTAAAISSIAFDACAAVVDGNVERVFCRWLDLREPPNTSVLKKAFKSLAQTLLDPTAPGDFNQALMELGQTICTPTSPACALCPVRFCCLALARESQALAPAPKAKPPVLDVHMRLTIFRDRTTKPETIALLERAASARFLKSTAGFLTEIKYGADFKPDQCEPSGATTASSVIPFACAATDSPHIQLLGKVKHSITKHRISADVRLIDLTAPLLKKYLPQLEVNWVRAADVEERLLANLDRKAWRLVADSRANIF